MIGDINMFLTPWDDDDDANDEENDAAAPAAKDSQSDTAGVELVRAEVDVMIAGSGDRGKGFGKAAVGAFLEFVTRNRVGILHEYFTATPAPQDGTRRPEIREFVARIQASNRGSLALFAGFGFRQRGEVNYFGEVEMVLRPAIGRLGEGTPSIGEIEVVEGYREAKYDRSGFPVEAKVA